VGHLSRRSISLNFLDRARNLLQGITPAAPAKVHYFSVVCPEGHRLRGERTEGYQALRCPRCGERIFVLSRSPLPELSGPAPARPSRRTLPVEGSTVGPEDEPVALIDPLPPRQPGDGEVEGEIEWIDPEHASVGAGGAANEEDVVQVEETAAPAKPNGRARRQPEAGPPRPRPARRPRLRPRGAPPVAVPVEPVESLRVRLGAWTWHRRHQLLFLAVVCVVLATVGYRLRWWRRQELPRIAEIDKTQGLAALDAGKFDLAYQLLLEAERAVDALGDASEGSAEIRRGAEEAAIFVNQVPDRLETILELADKPDPESWSSQFDKVYKGRAILIQASVTRVPNASGAGQYDLDYRVFPDGEGPRPRRVGRIDLRGFRLFESFRPKLGEKLLLGATLDSLRFDKDNEEWLFGLEPDSGVRITHTKALEALEWPSEDELQAEEKP
jgi:DNA-directed RNA polymerase subunit RPC12/RpoP